LFECLKNGAKSGDFGSKRLENHPKQTLFTSKKVFFLKVHLLHCFGDVESGYESINTIFFYYAGIDINSNGCMIISMM